MVSSLLAIITILQLNFYCYCNGKLLSQLLGPVINGDGTYAWSLYINVETQMIELNITSTLLNNWFAVGFGNDIMSHTYTIIYHDNSFVSSRYLGLYSSGDKISNITNWNKQIINDKIHISIYREFNPQNNNNPNIFIFNNNITYLECIWAKGNIPELSQHGNNQQIDRGQITFIFNNNTYNNSDDDLEKEFIDKMNELISFPNDKESKFKISLYAYNTSGIYRPRSMQSRKYNNSQIVYIGTNDASVPVYALVDIECDGINDYTIPVFYAFNDNRGISNIALDPLTNDIYFITSNNITICHDIHKYVMEILYNNNNTDIQLKCEIFMELGILKNDIPHARHYSQFTPNGEYLYIAFAADCDVCINDDISTPLTTIRAYNMTYIRLNNINTNNLPILWNDTNSFLVARGVRNSIGFDWHPKTKQFWFNDMGANRINDSYYDNKPDCELNVLSYFNQHFGYPYVHDIGTGDPYNRDINISPLKMIDELIVNSPYNISYFTQSIQTQGPHSSPLGIKFYDRSSYNINSKVIFPKEYDNVAFIAHHGLYANWADSGLVMPARVMLFEIEEEYDINIIPKIKRFEEFVVGWRNKGNAINDPRIEFPVFGRVCFVEFIDDGSMLLSDNYAHAIYRITYHHTSQQKSNTLELIVMFGGIILGIILIAILLFLFFKYKNRPNTADHQYELSNLLKN